MSIGIGIKQIHVTYIVFSRFGGEVIKSIDGNGNQEMKEIRS